VIKAIGVPAEYAKGTVRVSFGRDNTKEDAIKIAGELASIIRCTLKNKESVSETSERRRPCV
jgi:cysteine desulfurase